MSYRTEKDSLGTVNVPSDALWGAQTQRAIENFPISGLKQYRAFVWSMATIKRAAAEVNRDLGLLDQKLADAIVVAAQEVIDDKWAAQFVVDPIQAGAGTSHNMNVNEVIANRANQLLGYALDNANKPVNPNDHVNMAQSTNDTIPTAIRLGCLWRLDELLRVLDALADTLDAKAREFDGIVKSGRTHLQDAVPVRLGQEFGAYAQAVRNDRERIATAGDRLRRLGIGGTAAGTGLNADPEYRVRVCGYLAKWTGQPIVPAKDLFASMQSAAAFVRASSGMRTAAIELSKIANDIRLLVSGPRTGIGELVIPPVQPGSSIMPGKINPSIAEMVNQVCYQVIGNDTAVAFGAQAGQLELNVMMPVMAFNLNFAATIFGNALGILSERCVSGITADEERCRHYAESSLGLATALNAFIGYAKAAEVAKAALKQKKTILQVVREKKILSEKEIKKIMDPAEMTEPGIPGKK